MYGKVRINELDPTENLLDKLQITQNKCARFLHGSSIKDKINTKSIYKEMNLLVINQLNAQIKVREVWKSSMNSNYPIQWENMKVNPMVDRRLRSVDKGI